jgi:hypothetical protein
VAHSLPNARQGMNGLKHATQKRNGHDDEVF